MWRAIPTLNTTAISEKAKAEAAGWKTWSAEEVKSLNSEGKPVMVDFGASWCPSCQINEANVLSDPTVLAELDRCGFTRFKADWTSQDPKITAALAELGLNGVPVYALYAANRAGSKPHLLGEILSKKGLMDAANQFGTCSSSAQLQQGEASAAK